MSEHCWQCAVAEEQGWPKPHAPGRDCKHGHLARSCDTCDAEAERDELRAALRDLREWNWEEALALSDPKARRGAFRCQYCGGGSVSDDARRLHEQRCKRRPRG